MKIALLGYGTVGSGTAECLRNHPMEGVDLAKILDKRKIDEIKEILTDNIDDILNDGTIETVVEVMGGEEPAYTFVKSALLKGKNVVSANKLMLSRHYDELVNLAREKNLSLSFSAAAGGSIPWLFNLLRAKRVDNILNVGGVMNGTTNFILDKMQTGDGADFDKVLKEAQAKGYAEADPTADIDGLDVKAKIALSCDIAYSKMIDPDDIPALGIRYVTKNDIDNFKAMGYNCRLIGRGEKIGDEVAVYVEPMLFKPDAAEYTLAGAGNIISYLGEKMGKQSYFGLGAGKEPTGAAIVNDLYDIAAGISIFDMAQCVGKTKCRPELVCHEYYVRTNAEFDRSIVKEPVGDNAFITKKISVASMHELAQKIIADGKEIFAASIAE